MSRRHSYGIGAFATRIQKLSEWISCGEISIRERRFSALAPGSFQAFTRLFQLRFRLFSGTFLGKIRIFRHFSLF